MEITLGMYLALSTLVFMVGSLGFLLRRNALIQLMSIELMLGSVNILLIAFNRFNPGVEGAWQQQGQLFALFVIAVAAAEAAVGLAIVIALFKLKKHIHTDEISELRN